MRSQDNPPRQDRPPADDESDIPTDVGEGWPGKDAKTSDEPIRLVDGTTIPGDSGPFGEQADEDPEVQR
jgi:hypothetical protein